MGKKLIWNIIFLLKFSCLQQLKQSPTKERKKNNYTIKMYIVFEEYHFYFIKMIFAFLSRRETCLYINHYILQFLKF